MGGAGRQMCGCEVRTELASLARGLTGCGVRCSDDCPTHALHMHMCVCISRRQAACRLSTGCLPAAYRLPTGYLLAAYWRTSGTCLMLKNAWVPALWLASPPCILPKRKLPSFKHSWKQD
jgi:hypothetical protein